jgi:pSer/pThr/pTyr-binding forkhead associated (FHA) protein
MPGRLTLTLPTALGNKTVEVHDKRFTIGRTPENDLAIEDPSLSRRHALIETIEGRFNLSDCGSSNGTFINGGHITTPAQLEDWDVLTFGGIGDVVVRIEADSSPAREAAPALAANRHSTQAGTPSDRPKAVPTTYSSSKMPVIAIVASLSILLITGLALLIAHNSTPQSNLNSGKTRERSGYGDNTNAEKSDDSSTPPGQDSPGPVSDGNNLNTESGDLSAIETYASKVLTSISRDTHPVLSEKSLTAINLQVQQYRGSAPLQEELRTMKRALPQVTTIAKSNGVRTPLLVYVTLARIERDGRGDPAQVAAALCPTLAKMRVVFGDELANDSLLSVAALEEGEVLQGRITKLASRVNDSPTTIRSIWYLHDHQVISDQTYNFVIRFMAMGVVAQDPQKFGLNTDPLNF